jgi:MSHA biogenesis protein MshP
MSPSFSKQRGVSIITAIFLLLLFAALAGFMASLMTSSNMTSALDVQGMRARQAAQAGLEWGLFQLDPDDAASALPTCFASTPLNQVPGFVVTVSCTPFPTAPGVYSEANRTLRIYRIVANARAVGGSPVVERELTATIEKCRDPGVTTSPYGC